MTTFSQKSLAGGEIAPSLYARVDAVKYATGLRTCRNFLVMRHGGVASRPGTSFICEVKDSTKTVRLIPFIFNSSQTYVLEFGNLYIRVIYNDGQVLETAKNITGITQANPAVVTSNTHGYSNGDEVYISGVGGMTELNGRNFVVANKSTHTFELTYLGGANVNSTAFGAYTSGGTAERIYTITTTYAQADLSTLHFVQSADVITITHPNYAPAQLSRTGHSSWTLANISFAPTQAVPTSLTVAYPAGAYGPWVVTAVNSETFEESLVSNSDTSNTEPTADTPVAMAWVAASGAGQYVVYRSLNGVYGFIGIAGTANSFTDIGYTPDTTDTPPSARNPFSGAGNYPSTCAYIQGRLFLANSDNNPEKVWGSRVDLYKNFTVSTPLKDDDAVTFNLAGRQVNEVRSMIELGRMLLFTESGVWTIEGSSSGAIIPGEINPKQHAYTGSNSLQPLLIESTALYVQARGNIVRDLTYDFQVDGYRGNDLTIFAAHLFDGYTISDWAYQQIPHSLVWVARSDGILLGLTYIREHQIFGWHRHEIGDTVENTCCIPSGSEDALYVVTTRTIDSRAVRYIEKLNTRDIGDIVDYIGMDSTLTYDGTNTTATTMTISGGTTWANDELLTLTASSGFFTAADIGNAIHITASDGDIIRFSIEHYTNTTVVTGFPHKTVPVTLRAIASAVWTKAVDQVSNLWHLEGENVAVFADGFVVASPNNASYTVVTVTDGTITLDRPYGIIHVGVPMINDLETLDIDTIQGETLVDKKKLISRVSMRTENTRGLWSGPEPPSDDTTDPLENLNELQIRETESYDDPVSLATDVVDINILPEWNSNGRIFIRQVDPVPAAILSIEPAGLIPFRR